MILPVAAHDPGVVSCVKTQTGYSGRQRLSSKTIPTCVDLY